MTEHSGSEGGSHVIAIGNYIGALLAVFGVLIALYGLFGPPEQTEKSLGYNINLWWGLVMIACGGLGFLGTYLSRRKGPETRTR